tara:strand:- start:177 stop:884 length:708 start_codon:yes stop_codon:yes gene_type:complete
MKKILISGGDSNLAKELIKKNKKYEIFNLNKKKLNILKINSIISNIKKIKPKYFIHTAALSSPMKQHDNNIKKSIDLNIIGTANVVKACEEFNIKLIYISTNFVYPGINGHYKEDSALFPVNKYGWSKLGGESSVMLYDNSLILRVCMSKKPFPHKAAFLNYYTSFIYSDQCAEIIFKLLNFKGIINIGGKRQSSYDFASKDNPSIKKEKLLKKNNHKIGSDTSINIKKLNKIIK